MRTRSQKQLYFKTQSPTISLSAELNETTRLLESLQEYNLVLERVASDLNPRNSQSRAGRQGMTAEQVLLALLLRSRKNYSYRDLSEATQDSLCSREFLKIAPHESGFHYKTLQSNIKLISEETLDYLHEALKVHSKVAGIEDGQKTRTDATAIEANIHYPSDSSQLNDCIRVLSRIMTTIYEDIGVPIVFTNHYRASKKKLFRVNNTRNTKRKRRLNVELIRLCRKTIGYANNYLENPRALIENSTQINIARLTKLESELAHYIPLSEQVADIAHHRIIQGKNVPANEKIFSIFEEHTDIIVKGQRDIVFGHKSTITTGRSGMILDIHIHDGNPSDASIVKEVIQKHEEFYNAVPDSMVFDGCYNSDANRQLLLERGVNQLTFSKEDDAKATCSRAVRKALRFFRAGIEATVSMLKRMFGWTRVLDKGKESFSKALKTGAVAYNLFILSRLQLKS